MEVLLVVLFDSLLEGADELAAIVGEDILYGEGEHHLDQLGEAGSPLARGTAKAKAKGQAAGVVEGGKDVATLPFNEQNHGIKGGTMAQSWSCTGFPPTPAHHQSMPFPGQR